MALYRGFWILALIILLTISTIARSSYTGYSGAPGSRGQCAGSCHGSTGGSIQVAGFPTAYNPGEQYTITVTKSSGSSINQFNASIRVATGTQNAGTITASTGTSTYNVSGETNGIHLSSANQNSATFLWTAPATGVGSVRLYLAGMQGSTMSGANTNLVLTANEQTSSINEEFQVAHNYYLLENYPNPFNVQTNIRFAIPVSENVKIDIYDLTGKRIANICDSYYGAGQHSAVWNASVIPSGVYFCKMITKSKILTKKIVLLK